VVLRRAGRRPEGSARRGCDNFMNCVYILKSLRDGKQYIGSTTSLEKRVSTHNKGQVKSTKNRKPLVLFGYQICGTIQEAARLEKSYKRSHGLLDRSLKRGDFKLVYGE